MALQNITYNDGLINTQLNAISLSNPNEKNNYFS